MQLKSQVHEALSLLAQHEGVPPALVMDNAKEQIMGEFRCKAREMGCHVKQTEPYTPWSNAAENAIREHTAWNLKDTSVCTWQSIRLSFKAKCQRRCSQARLWISRHLLNSHGMPGSITGIVKPSTQSPRRNLAGGLALR